MFLLNCLPAAAVPLGVGAATADGGAGDAAVLLRGVGGEGVPAGLQPPLEPGEGVRQFPVEVAPAAHHGEVLGEEVDEAEARRWVL